MTIPFSCRIPSQLQKSIVLLLVWFLGFPFREANAQPEISSTLCPSDLPFAINQIVNRPEWQRSRWGILIQPLNGQTPLYSFDADHYFIPASNAKLFTTAAALTQLGSQFRLRTSAYGPETLPQIETLWVVGRGDPSFSTEQLQNLAQQLHTQGIRHIQTLRVNDHYFPDPSIHPTWEWEDTLFYYGTAVNSLILNENAVVLKLYPQAVGDALRLEWSDEIAARQWNIENQGITVASETENDLEIRGVFGEPTLQIQGQLMVDGKADIWGISIVNPAQYFLDSFRQVLEAAGITVGQGTWENQGEWQGEELAFVDSPPLGELIRGTNQPSNNLYAEALRQTLRLNRSETLEDTLTQLGVTPDSYFLADGSGLSRRNFLSPEAVVQLLIAMAKQPEGEIYRDSLPVAGVSGTLRSRFQGTPLEGIVQGKTGTLTGVSALSGYIALPQYQPVVFSIFINQTSQPVAMQRSAIDEIVLLLGQVRSCPEY